MKIKSSGISKKMIMIALFTVLIGSALGSISAVARDPYNPTEVLFINDIDHMNNISKPEYTKNFYGQTYGSASLAAYPEQEPDLIAAIGIDGTEGYVYKKELYGEIPKTVKEALARQDMTLKNFEMRQIPLYEKDGKTVIGTFEISGFAVEDVEAILEDVRNLK